MYCLQWLIPVLLIPKPVNPALLYNHVVFMILYLASFFIERKPCTICSLVFIFALILICTSGYGNCLFWNDEDQCPREAEGILKMWLILRAQSLYHFPLKKQSPVQICVKPSSEKYFVKTICIEI